MNQNYKKYKNIPFPCSTVLPYYKFTSISERDLSQCVLFNKSINVSKKDDEMGGHESMYTRDLKSMQQFI